MSTIKTPETHTPTYAEVIFSQLRASKVNGFPFFAYSGIKAMKLSDTDLLLDCPNDNPGKINKVLISMNLAWDTYTITIVPKKENSKKYENIYADGMVDLIVREMGIN